MFNFTMASLLGFVIGQLIAAGIKYNSGDPYMTHVYIATFLFIVTVITVVCCKFFVKRKSDC